MLTDFQKIRNSIERALEAGKRNFILYPFGEYGVMAKQILNNCFGIEECYIIDNKLSKFNSNIKSLDFLKNLDSNNYIILFTCANPDVYEEVFHQLKNYFPERCIIKLFTDIGGVKKIYTQCGKYSYGPLCNHWLVKSVGSFCSFAPGADVLENHSTAYISTAPFIYRGKECNSIFEESYLFNKDFPFYFEGVLPKGKSKNKRIVIGNDVWLGKNVLITNGANIGNGVIGGAGSVITKDIPDYAVVVGAPARIIRYRYTHEQIRELNDIAWWDWPDEKIRECYNDFFEDIDRFIAKHRK